MSCTLYALALAAWMALGGTKPADSATQTCNGGWPDW